MKKMNRNIEAFFALLRAGIWEQNVQLSGYEPIDFNEVYRLAEEQSVVGLIAAGLEHVTDSKIPKEVVLQFVGQTLQLEQRNIAMNKLIRDLIIDLRKADVYTLLVKGQGVAQCYERPLWRASGDIDFYMSEENFLKAREFFRTKVDAFYPDNDNARRIEMNYGQWVVELHANQRITLSERANRVLDEIHRDLFYGGNVRSWLNDSTSVFLPSPNNDVLIVFTHYLNHFYKGGIGLRQICDWCRLLYTFNDKIDRRLLENRIRKMGFVREWRAFAMFAVTELGMPTHAMPMYKDSKRLKRKAKKIKSFILEVGNFGHNRNLDYYGKYPYLIRKFISMKIRTTDLLSHARIFPIDTLRFFPNIMFNGLRSAFKGE